MLQASRPVVFFGVSLIIIAGGKSSKQLPEKDNVLFCACVPEP